MISGLRYRLAGIAGTVGLTAGAVALSNLAFVQEAVVRSGVAGRLDPTTLSNGDLALAVATTVLVVGAGFVPLYKPHPRRLLDTIALAERRVLLVAFVLATIGYFDYTYRLPRITLLLLSAVLAVSLPAWFVLIRRRPGDDVRRAVIVGDDSEAFEDVLDAIDVPVTGYVSPPATRTVALDGGSDAHPIGRPDGGQVLDRAPSGGLESLDCLGGLSRLDEVIVDHDVDTAILAFAEPSRTEFFGVLDTCQDHGVTAKIHQDHADAVLTTDVDGGDHELVDIDLEPWDPQDYLFKRIFDVVFALTGLVLFAPFAALIAAAIKLDSDGPVFYRQTRTAAFGGTFEVYKFRTMLPESEDATPTADADNDRITRVGRVLRQTHVDELPQLWSILTGRMSAVGPRAAWVEEETLLEERTDSWRCRWFVKPGLTGLAQINGVESTDPEAKLRYDIAYIRNQSFRVDLKIVLRQVWQVLRDVRTAVRRRRTAGANDPGEESA